MTLDDLLAHLPDCMNPPPLVPSELDVRYVTKHNPYFVAPDLGEVMPLSPGSTSVVLISASAAIGKSTLAEHVALCKGAPLWNLAGGFQVGSNTLGGTILQTYGPSATSTIVQLLQSGHFLIVIDAFDEAELSAGEANFDAFLQEICRGHKSPRTLPSLVVLARVETAEAMTLWFEDQSVPYARYDIEFFDEPRAAEFIEKRLDAMCEQKDRAKHHRTHAVRFGDAMKGLFRFVIEILDTKGPDPWAADRVRRFLGYAPVLVALADYLEEPNYQVIINELEEARAGRAGEGTATPWDFLTRIMVDLLAREQKKFLDQLKTRLQRVADNLGWSGWADLFTPMEQCRRVLGRVLKTKHVETTRSRLPEKILEAYQDVVKTTMRNHPFLEEPDRFAHVVFQEYLYAGQLARSEDELADAVRRSIRRADYLPTPLLGRFMLSLAPGEEQPSIRAQDLGLLYESFFSQAQRAGDVGLYVWQLDPENNAEGVLVVGDEAGDDLPFRLTSVRSGIQLWRRLAYATVSVECGVQLGVPDGSFVLGPDVVITCDEFRCAAKALRVKSENDGVVIEAASYDPMLSYHPKLRVHGDRFGVRWPNLVYPWIDYPLEAMPSPDTGDVLVQAYTHLSRMLLWFRSSGYGELACPLKLFDNVAVGRTEMAKQLKDFIVAEGLLRADMHMYRLNRSIMARVGINRMALRRQEMVPGISEFLGKFVRQY